MKKFLKITLFLLLFSTLILFLSYTTVKAETTTTIEGLQQEIGGSEYAEIDGNKIIIVKDVIQTTEIGLEDMNATIDFNGKIFNKDVEIYVKSNAKLTLQDTKEGGYVTVKSIKVEEGGELIIKSGRYIGEAMDGTNINVYGKLTIDGGNFEEYSICLCEKGNVTINGGEFTENRGSFFYDHIIQVQNDVKPEALLTVNNGTFRAYRAILYVNFYTFSGEEKLPKIVLNNGTMESTGYPAIDINFSRYSDTNEYSGLLTINGGTYKGKHALAVSPSGAFNKNDFNIKGGTFESIDEHHGAIALLDSNKDHIVSEILNGYTGKVYDCYDRYQGLQGTETTRNVKVASGSVTSASGEVEKQEVITGGNTGGSTGGNGTGSGNTTGGNTNTNPGWSNTVGGDNTTNGNDTNNTVNGAQDENVTVDLDKNVVTEDTLPRTGLTENRFTPWLIAVAVLSGFGVLAEVYASKIRNKQ